MPCSAGGIGRLAVLLALLLAPPTTAQAQPDASPASTEARQQEEQAAWDAAKPVTTHGPALVPLLDEGELELPPDVAFVTGEAAARILRARGDQVAADTLGLIVGRPGLDRWSVVVRFVKNGHVTDEEARDWDAATLLRRLRDRTESANADRHARGLPEQEIAGWIAPPSYDADAHRLIASIALRGKDSANGAQEAVEYFTYLLGRDGYFLLELLTDRQDAAHDREIGAELADNVTFANGRRYRDFTLASAQIAPHGLSTLVSVAGAKKLGALAFGSLLKVKFAVAGVLVAAIAACIAMVVFRRRRRRGNVA